MTFLLELVVSGVVVGCVYALAALGFVLIYKSSRVINFAHGQMIAAGAIIVLALSRAGVPLPLAALGGLAASFLLGLAVERVFLRPMVGEPIISVIMVTIGLASVLNGLLHLTPYGSSNYSFPRLFAGGPVRLGPVNVGSEQLLAVGITVAFVVGLALFFQRSTLGISMRAVADDQLASLSVGVSVERVFALAWAAAAVTATAAGVAVGAIAGVNYGSLAAIGIKVFPAVILGGLDSIAGAVVGGIVVGVLESLAAGYLDGLVPGGGTRDVFPFVLLVLVLLVKPYGLFGTREIERV